MEQNIYNEIRFFSEISENPCYDETIAKRIIRMANLPKNSKILDAGCGEGYWGIQFMKEGHDVIGIDLSNKITKQTRLKVKIGDLKKKNFEENSFDAVICGGVLHHFPSKGEVEIVVSNFRECLKKDGKIILIEPNGTNPVIFFSRLIGRFLVSTYSNKIASVNERMYGVFTYIKILNKYGFEIIIKDGYFYDASKKMRSNTYGIRILTKIREKMTAVTWKVFPYPYNASEIIIIAKTLK